MDAVKLMGQIIKESAEVTANKGCIGPAKLVVFCNAPEDNPFMAGAFHGVTEADAIINVGVSGPGVVKTALEQVRGENFEVLCETIKKTAFKVTRVGQLVAQEASKRLGVPFGIVDLSLAPTPAVGDSVAEILEEIGLEQSGLDRLISKCYSLLGLISYLTAGQPEVRAWTITKGTKAPGAAGKIHSDFERGFIRAEVIAFDELMKHGTMTAAKEAGLSPDVIRERVRDSYV